MAGTLGKRHRNVSKSLEYPATNYYTCRVGDRNGRWAMVIEKDGTISYADAESGPGKVTVRQNKPGIFE